LPGRYEHRPLLWLLATGMPFARPTAGKEISIYDTIRNDIPFLFNLTPINRNFIQLQCAPL